MTGKEQETSELLEQYWAALVDDPAAPAPDGLDPELAEVSRKMARQAAVPQPDIRFALALQNKLIRQAKAMEAARQQRAAALPSIATWFAGRRAALGGLAVLAVAILAGLGLWAVNPQSVDAQAAVRQARAVMSRRATSLQSLVLFQKMTIEYEEADGTRTAQSESKRWYQAPNYWHSEDTGTVIGPDGKVIAAAISQDVTVGDGKDIWNLDSIANEVIVNPEPADMAHISNAFLFGFTATDLEGFLQPDTTCPDYRPLGTATNPARVAPMPKFRGRATVAGRPTYIIDLGAVDCPSVPGLNGRRVIWVDQEGFFVLKSELHRLGDDRVISTVETTHIEYNPTLDKSLFTFTPPAGAHILDLR